MTHLLPAAVFRWQLENINRQLAFPIALDEAEEQVAGRARLHRRLNANCEPTPRAPVADARLIKSPAVGWLADVGLRCARPAAPASHFPLPAPSSSQIKKRTVWTRLSSLLSARDSWGERVQQSSRRYYRCSHASLCLPLNLLMNQISFPRYSVFFFFSPSFFSPEPARGPRSIFWP